MQEKDSQKRLSTFGFVNTILLAISGLSFLAILVVFWINHGKQNSAADFLLIIFSVISSVLASLAASNISHKIQLKRYASSAMRHLDVVFTNASQLCERASQGITHVEKSEEKIDKIVFIETLRSIDELGLALTQHIQYGASNWENILEDEVVLYREAFARLRILEQEKTELQKQIDELLDQGDTGRKDMNMLKEKMAKLEQYREGALSNVAASSASLGALPVIDYNGAVIDYTKFLVPKNEYILPDIKIGGNYLADTRIDNIYKSFSIGRVPQAEQSGDDEDEDNVEDAEKEADNENEDE